MAPGKMFEKMCQLTRSRGYLEGILNKNDLVLSYCSHFYLKIKTYNLFIYNICKAHYSQINVL